MGILQRPRLRNGRKFGETFTVLAGHPPGRCDVRYTAYGRFLSSLMKLLPSTMHSDRGVGSGKNETFVFGGEVGRKGGVHSAHVRKVSPALQALNNRGND